MNKFNFNAENMRYKSNESNEKDNYIYVLCMRDHRWTPIFFEDDNIEHKQVWNLLQKIIWEISKLCHKKILDKSTIVDIALHIQMISKCINEVSNDCELNKRIYKLIYKNIDKYINESIELELYEITENLNKLKNVYK